MSTATAARLVFATVLGLAVAGDAFGQFGGLFRRGGSGGGESRSRQDDGNQAQSEVVRMSAGDKIRLELTKVRVSLKLTPDQLAPWQAYESKVIELLEDQAQGPRAASGEGPGKQIDQNVGVLRKRLSEFEELAAAATKLYATFNASQRDMADRMLPATVPPAFAPAQAAQRDREADKPRTTNY